LAASEFAFCLGDGREYRAVTFDEGRVGFIDGDDVVELGVGSMREYFELGGKVEPTGARLPLSNVRLRAPIVPKKFFHTAGNFRDHHTELAAVNWSHPVHKGIVFFQNVDAIIGPDDAIVYPEGLTKELDYELELVVVIGKSGKFFGPEEAEDYIAGYMVFNDITARDIQRREMQSGVFSFSKAIDTFCPIGPWIITKDEIADVNSLRMELRVNGEVRQKGNTSQLLISLQHLVAYHSAQGYSAGDIITTGTISGVAAVQPNPSISTCGPATRSKPKSRVSARSATTSWPGPTPMTRRPTRPTSTLLPSIPDRKVQPHEPNCFHCRTGFRWNRRTVVRWRGRG
jgi:2-keto-4-pentenoate hydratase/2-oxohepta-3-ene-1,7-dioic acid hydratase in catechol pathway